ncbi:hypothetical protein IMZ48_08695 [Candidatus Bathyarchaeota archaeon]|nr:hypothetical protein [Candidatus Bathyarchaeota archaeon]
MENTDPRATRKATTGLGLYCCETNGRRVFFVDTPGFDDTRCSDTEAFREIAHFLARVYTSGARLAGVFCLHRITDNRVSGSAARSFSLVKKICGPKAAPFALLVTTMWDSIPGEGSRYVKATERDDELSRTEGYWGSMLKMGSRAHRWMGTRASGLSILSGLLWQYDAAGPVILRIQEELVDKNRDLDETDAGMELAKHHGAKWQGHQKEIRELRASIEREVSNKNTESAALLRTQKRDLEHQLKKSEAAEQDLREGLHGLFEAKARHYQALFKDTQREAHQASREVRELQTGLDLLRRQLRDDAVAFEDEVRRCERAKSAAAAAGQRKRLEEDHQKRRARYERKRKEAEGKQRITEEDIKKKEIRKRWKRNSLAILGMLGGIATIAAGGATMQIPVVAAGIALFGTAGMKLDFSKKKKRDEDKAWEVQEHDDS